VGQSSQQSVTLTVNAAVPITSIKIAANFTDYTLGTITGSGCTIDATGNTVVAAGTVCTIPVTFKPAYPGLASAPPPIGRTAPLLVTDVESGKANGYSFALTGTATGSVFSFAPGYVTGLVGNTITRGCTGQLDGAGDGCPAIDAFVITSGTAIDAAGNIYIANGVGKVIHKVDPVTGIISVFAGQYFVQGESGNGGPATSATFYEPYTIALDQAGNLYLNDLTNGFGNDTGELWKINAATGVATIISTTGSFPGPFQLAQAVAGGKTIANTAVPWITGMVVDQSGNIYFTGLNYGGVYRIDAVTGVVSIVVGNGTPTYPAKGVSGPGTSALVGTTGPLAVDGSGNLYIGDTENGLVYSLNTTTGQLTVVAGTQFTSSSTAACTTQGDWGPATSAVLYSPGTLSLDAAGNLYIASGGAGNAGCQIRRVDALSGTIYSIDGDVTGYYQPVENTGGNNASLAPDQIIVDGGGNIYVSQQAAIVGVQKIVASESGINFRQQSQDVTATQLVTASNIGVETELQLSNYPFPIVAGAGSATPMPFTSPELTGSDPQDCAVGTLPAGGVCGIQVSFDPVANGSYNATETVMDNSLGEAGTSNVIDITGSAYNNQTVALAPNPVAFSPQAVGSPSSPMLVIFSSALSPSITFGTATLSGAGASSYQVTTGNNSCTANESLAGAGGLCDLYVVFTPQTSGPLPATLTANYTAGGVNYAVTAQVTGSGAAASAPAVTLTPTLAFPNTTVGATAAALSATVSNTGNAALNITGVSIAGANATDFAISTGANACATTLAAGANCSIYVTFTPASAASFNATLQVADNATGSPQSSTLTGTGTAAAAPVATLTPSLTFASTTVGNTSLASATLSNTGNAALNITGVTIGGANPSDFSQTNTCGSSLAAGSSCTISVIFTPASASSFTATLQVADNATGSPQTATLTGTGTAAPAPVASLTPASIPFGSLTAGTTSAAMSATLSNTGNATLNITGITISGASPTDFAVATGANACGSTLAAGANCSIYVTFTPASAASFSATLQVADNASGSPQASTLTGTGTAPPAPAATLAPNPVAFASETIGATSAATTVTLTNSGNATLTITGITIAGANAAEFAMTTGSNACGASLAAGATCNVYVTFTPAAGVSYSATLSVADNATGSPQTVPLSGSGINPADFAVSATPASQTVQPGGSTTYAVSVSSTGGTFSSPVGLTVSGLPTGATGSFSPTSITPGSESSASTLTVQTGTTTQQTARNSAWPLAAPVLAALGLFFIPGKRRRRWITLGMLLVGSLGTLTALSGCGGGFSFVKPSQTYTLTITGTSGNDTHSTTVQLTVQ
jgi:hypothetical protein